MIAATLPEYRDWLLVQERCALCERSFIVKLHSTCLEHDLECPDCCRQTARVEKVLG